MTSVNVIIWTRIQETCICFNPSDFFCFCFLKVLIFVRICFDVGRKMVEEYFQPDSWQQQNEAHSAKTFKKSFLRFLFIRWHRVLRVIRNYMAITCYIKNEEQAVRRGGTACSRVRIGGLGGRVRWSPCSRVATDDAPARGAPHGVAGKAARQARRCRDTWRRSTITKTITITRGLCLAWSVKLRLG